MNREIRIARAREAALAGRPLTRGEILDLLAIDPESAEADLLGKAAREAASAICGNRAYLWGAIGIDHRPCPMNCSYCSLGAAWGIVTENAELPEEEVIRLARRYSEEGVRWIVLRTTQHYEFQRLMELCRRVKREVPGSYELGLNAGEFDGETAETLLAAGVEFVYHNLRLKEGTDTGLTPAERRQTLEVIRKSGLKLAALVEPVGIEHTDEEIADLFLEMMEYQPFITGAMNRVPVKGTPKGDIPSVSPRRLAQIGAVIRLAAGRRTPHICIHKASQLAPEWGANATVIETGSIPRDITGGTKVLWNDFDPVQAREWFEKSGYAVHAEE